MKLERDFELSSDDLFDYIEESFIKSVEDTTSKKIKPKDMKPGFKYTRTDSSTKKTIVTLKNYVRGSIYCVRSEDNLMWAETSYTVTDTDKGIHVIAELNSSDMEKSNKELKGFKKKFYDFVFMSRLSRSLYNMTSEVTRRVNGLVETKAPLGYEGSKHIAKKINDKLFNKDKEKNNEE